FYDVLSLLGGLAMFLYGMRLMGDSLKENSSGTLKVAMEHVTNNPVKAFVLGVLVTALIQSSTATIVITAGLVGAGVLTLHQSLGIIIGANVGTTVTGQIIRLLDLESSGGVAWLRLFQPATLSSVALIAGMVIIMSGKVRNAKSVGGIAIGFGVLFSGLLNMTGAVDALSQSGLIEDLFAGLGKSPILGYLTGAGIAFLLQSSSATVGILQAFSASGLLTFKAIYAVIVGIYLGDCVTTAIVCSIGAENDQKRVGVVNILFNLSKTVVVLVGVTIAHRLGLMDRLWDSTVNSGVIANTNTVFNLTCAVLLMPMVGVYEKYSRMIVKDTPAPETPRTRRQEKLDALNPVFFNTPALALNACYRLLLTIFAASRANVERACRLLETFDEDLYQEVLSEEDEIDRMTDRVSRYAMELLPHLQLDLHVTILDQYYKVITEFERLGDHAVNIANNAEGLSRHNTAYSPLDYRELSVLEDALGGILDLTELTFRKRSVDAARAIEPRVQAAEEVITLLRRRRMARIRAGQGDTYADSSFTSLLIELKRITSVCSNVGISTMVRVYPELADHEHGYYERLRSGEDEAYNAAFQAARQEYFGALEQIGAEERPEGV
ncbi:MAG: Na/Pi cotransporter family protein, partial [Oscillibacter sp.]|nr:Na/Pi cotransporter family protein [Oscillibacter sp.]